MSINQAEQSLSTSDVTQQGEADAPQQGEADAPQQGEADAPKQGEADAPQQGVADAPEQGESDARRRRNAGRDKVTPKELTQNAAPPVAAETTYPATANPEETNIIAADGNEETLTNIEKRLTKLTPKAYELYLASKNQLEQKLDKAWVSTKSKIVNLNTCNDDVDTIRSYMNFVRVEFNKYRDVHEQLSTLMTRANTQLSLQECRTLTEVWHNREDFVSKALQEAHVRCQEIIETASVVSHQSAARSKKSKGNRSNRTASVVSHQSAARSKKSKGNRSNRTKSGSFQASNDSQRRSVIQRNLAKLEEERRVGSASTSRKLAELEIETQRQKERARLQEEEEREAAKIIRKQAELTMQLSM